MFAFLILFVRPIFITELLKCVINYANTCRYLLDFEEFTNFI